MQCNPTIRPADFLDSKEIFELIKQYPNELVPKPMSDVVQNIDRFLVCDEGEGVIGTASWKILPEVGAPRNASVEIQSVAVNKNHTGKGIGKALVNAIISRIEPMHPAQVIVLTFTPPFFEKFGFKEISKRTIMHKIYIGCINCAKYDSPFSCPEVAMALPLKGLRS